MSETFLLASAYRIGSVKTSFYSLEAVVLNSEWTVKAGPADDPSAVVIQFLTVSSTQYPFRRMYLVEADETTWEYRFNIQTGDAGLVLSGRADSPEMKAEVVCCSSDAIDDIRCPIQIVKPEQVSLTVQSGKLIVDEDVAYLSSAGEGKQRGGDAPLSGGLACVEAHLVFNTA